MQIKIFITLLSIFLFSFTGKTQSFERQVFSNGSIDSAILTYNIGEAFVGYYSNGCISLSMGQHPGDPNICNGINDNLQLPNFYLRPNPCYDYIYVNTQFDNFEMKIFLANGEWIYTSKGLKKINVLQWPPGVYICAMRFSNYQTQYNKFIKL